MFGVACTHAAPGTPADSRAIIASEPGGSPWVKARLRGLRGPQSCLAATRGRMWSSPRPAQTAVCRNRGVPEDGQVAVLTHGLELDQGFGAGHPGHWFRVLDGKLGLGEMALGVVSSRGL